MRNWLLGVLVALSGLSLSAGVPEKIETLSSKVILEDEDSDGYFGLSDGSCWKVVTFMKRWRTISEWWSDVEIIPANYNCHPENWVIGTEIKVYPKEGNLIVDEADAANQEDLELCTHLLYNSETAEIVFAIALHPSDALSQLSKEARKEGHDEGYRNGYDTGYNVGSKEGYTNGDNQGYKRGFEEGRVKGRDEGYTNGDNQGYRRGFGEGRVKGEEEGYKKGYDEGHKRGRTEAYQRGYEEGYKKKCKRIKD